MARSVARIKLDGGQKVTEETLMKQKYGSLSICLSVCQPPQKTRRSDGANISSSEAAVLCSVRSFTPQSVLRQVHSLFHSEFSTQCDLVLPLAICSILSFP